MLPAVCMIYVQDPILVIKKIIIWPIFTTFKKNVNCVVYRNLQPCTTRAHMHSFERIQDSRNRARTIRHSAIHW